MLLSITSFVVPGMVIVLGGMTPDAEPDRAPKLDLMAPLQPLVPA